MWEETKEKRYKPRWFEKLVIFQTGNAAYDRATERHATAVNFGEPNRLYLSLSARNLLSTIINITVKKAQTIEGDVGKLAMSTDSYTIREALQFADDMYRYTNGLWSAMAFGTIEFYDSNGKKIYNEFRMDPNDYRSIVFDESRYWDAIKDILEELLSIYTDAIVDFTKRFNWWEGIRGKAVDYIKRDTAGKTRAQAAYDQQVFS